MWSHDYCHHEIRLDANECMWWTYVQERCLSIYSGTTLNTVCLECSSNYILSCPTTSWQLVSFIAGSFSWWWSPESVHVCQQRFYCKDRLMVFSQLQSLSGLLIDALTTHHVHTDFRNISLFYALRSTFVPIHAPRSPPALLSLQLRDLEGQGAAKVQEERSFLFG